MANVEDEPTPATAGGAQDTPERERGASEQQHLESPYRETTTTRSNPTSTPGCSRSYDTSFRNIAEGEVVKGTVLKVTASEVIVDVGYKSEGIIAVE